MRNARWVILAVFAAACGKSSSPASSPPPPPPPAVIDASVDAAPIIDAAPAPDAAPAAGSTRFEDLSHEEQVAFMKEHVMPAMKTAFKGYDAHDFATFSCKTCHGDGAVTKKYDMPNPKLPKLDFAKLRAGKDAKMVKFMKDDVTPKMAELLGEPVADETHPGFDCLACHVEKK